jgi:hypothetical protein
MTTKYRRNGREAGAAEALDEDGILRDGFSVTVPMAMRDGLTPLQRSVALNGLHDARVTDADGTTAGLHRPGYRIVDAKDARAAVERAHDEYRRELTNAWRGGSERDAREYPASAEGKQCTVRGYKYRDHFGAPGTVVNGECVPDELQRDALPTRDSNTMTLDQLETRHQQNMARQYAAYDARVREMWRNP